MKTGVLIPYAKGMNFEKRFQEAVDLGITSCQLSWWIAEDYTDEAAKKVLGACAKTGMEISALWAGWSGPAVWDFYSGPVTLGLVPPAYRFKRLEELKAASDFAQKIGVVNMATHVGFLPENPNDPDFMGTVAALRVLAKYMQEKGQYFLFETGQETPVTMLRAIEAIGTDNLGVNFDTANLIVYGKANTLDALDLLGKYVRDLHVKDGLYPTCGSKLGKQTMPGEGGVDFPKVIEKLKKVGYSGPLTIECEISGEEKQVAGIIKTRDMLNELWNS